MSRSRRRTPIFSNAVNNYGEKDDKRRANRVFRRRVKIAMATGRELPLMREVSDVRVFMNDGKGWWRNAGSRDMRK